jgi:hypothetical protein
VLSKDKVVRTPVNTPEATKANLWRMNIKIAQGKDVNSVTMLFCKAKESQSSFVEAIKDIGMDVASLYPSWYATKCGEVGVVGLELPGGTQAKG